MKVSVLLVSLLSLVSGQVFVGLPSALSISIPQHLVTFVNRPASKANEVPIYIPTKTPGRGLPGNNVGGALVFV